GSSRLSAPRSHSRFCSAPAGRHRFGFFRRIGIAQATRPNVRARNPDAWEEHKMRKLGGHQRLPQGSCAARDEHPRAATSGRTEPSRAPQWHSAHSGSSPTTPVRTPEKPSDKAWVGLVDHVQATSKLPRERVVSLLKSIPAAQKVMGKAAEELLS